MCEVELSLPFPQNSGEGLTGLGMIYFLGMGVEKVYMHHTTPHHMYTRTHVGAWYLKFAML